MTKGIVLIAVGLLFTVISVFAIDGLDPVGIIGGMLTGWGIGIVQTTREERRISRP